MNPNKVAVVDDDPDFTEMISLRLRHEGFDVASYHSGIELLSDLATDQPSIIVLDINMPEMSGQQVAFHLHENYPNIKIIIASAVLDEREKNRTKFWSEAIAFFQKPFELDKLIGTIRNNLPMTDA